MDKVSCHSVAIREFQETPTATATGTSQNTEKNSVSTTASVHVRYNSWFIPLPYSVKQQREMTNLRCLENVNHDG